MPRFLQVLCAASLVALMVGVPVWYKFQHDRHYRNFHVVRAGKLYRSGQLDLDGMRQLVRTYGIKTIVCLRADDTELSRQEEEWARGLALHYVRIPPRPWHAEGGVIPAEKGLRAFRAVMDDPARYPVLVHCFAGVHRTGAYCAVYRMDYEGWTNREALNEMRLMGYETLGEDRDILGYLVTYGSPGPARAVQARPVSRQGP
jgi:tyrosine-protein phosphatase SIW14